ncbi:hypothetical protein EL22_06685 [Halostagnicola sp. A56]|uniref:DUF368 domain-containing protein n=1 Tax=Halostagnicola sp. A56 TaxID=1495067 RepID=UPI0004A186D0|nr:DUF368 domain-containing protein [Halostagnicola sp. A56]KDE58174.1 hypothetical protein EL22_06685 [Halostagnicola sp. A56]
MREFLRVYCKGLSMGAADVVPGVSGATIALIVGIYDRLIQAITAIDPREFGPAVRLHTSAGRQAFRELFERTDAAFLISLGLGIATSIVVLSQAMHTAVTSYPVPTYGFFFGLIAASAVVLYGNIDTWTARRLVVAAVGILIALAVTGVSAGGISHALPFVFVAGAIAICAMVLPGVSGSFFLILLGQYEYMTGTLSSFVDSVFGLVTGEPLEPVVDAGTIVVVFVVGAAIGLFSMAHIVRRALDRYRALTLVFLVSLMVGSLRLPIEKVAAGLDGGVGQSPFGVLVAVVAAVVGAASVLVIDRYTEDLDYA